MSFVHWFALAVVALVLAPVTAHLLRRRRAPEQPFPPAALVPASPPAARRRSQLEDPALFVLRLLAIVALALLGATPLVRCTRLSLGRKAGASVALAIVIDDSLSMRARAGDRSKTRLEKAKLDAADLLGGLREGDAVGLFLAGAPGRVVIAPTPDVAAASQALEACKASDRATDLEGTIAIARAALRDLPQTDKRIVLFSDRADGHSQGPALGEGLDIPLWAPPREPESKAADCAVIRADQRTNVVVARVACSEAAAATGRSLEARSEGRVLGSVALPPLKDSAVAIAEVAIDLRAGVETVDRVVLVGPADSIAEDDQAAVGSMASSLNVAVISERATSSLVTGGPPPVEQALEALDTGSQVRPLPVVPETAEELSGFAALVIDDPPGLTPETRRALTVWLEKGGVALLSIGPRAASAPLGSSLEPFLTRAARWETQAPAGIEVASAAILGSSAEGLAELRAQGRGVIEADPRAAYEVLARWSDHAPFLIRKDVGRGTAFVVDLPLTAEASDLVVRPAFLALLDLVVETARARGSSRRIEVGALWTFEEGVSVEVRNEAGPVLVEAKDGHSRVAPAVAGRYDFRLRGQAETRFAMIPERELDLRPRPVAESATRSELGGTTSSIDISRHLALLLLGLLAAEMVVRVVLSRRDPRQKQATSSLGS